MLLKGSDCSFLKFRHDVDSTLPIVSVLLMFRVGINFRHGVEEFRMCCLMTASARLKCRHEVDSTLAIVPVLRLRRRRGCGTP